MVVVDPDRVRKACRGDSDAFLELIQERKDDIYKLIYTYVKNREDALDVLHDVVYKLYISLKKLKTPEFFNAWLIRITVNCCIDQLRKSKKIAGFEIKYDDPGALEQIADDSQNHGELIISNIDLFNAIDKLSIEQRTVVILKYFQDLTLSQVAEVLACPVGTVKTRLNKALRYLRRELKEGY
ncbi:RNA polymerase sigma factor [Pelotomaculum terephthalicicum JT]|uniref:sigma-70 family RNA polymerase sigma factor n=1 Tax=Pelotomaculum TaxID=191373 RepID=UPI0009D5AB02|nr:MULTISPECIES: sigma-70 family RNA polymerase sigma factor [Pelotomaculum]MCG9968945.1 RNA polymerase sigma factor [Pelotomaculum terephthalicicum JT]OPX86860.1 MAG: RNA polymerase sigma factor SigV [Pelotomaculum sp. PtaB.Bin117]OPY58051.1 MAG: RNA polymerase sigma factor SigV [Pelotomaculum sp. PtaU1.Bin065]